jgi:protein-L-isoaspartate(D-aspartate) O-methyltransferase
MGTLVAILFLTGGCADATRRGTAAAPFDFAAARERMVREQLAARGIADPRVLATMRRVPRHEFVPAALRDRACDDEPLPIGHRATISQPYVVALMTELARLRPDARVLEIGTGSGYQAAILAELAREVYTIEIVEALGRQAQATLARLGYGRVQVRIGDGRAGWPSAAPFDAIIVTAAPATVPPPLLDQLAPDGRLVSPVGERDQRLEVHHRTSGGIEVERVAPVAFVPMAGAARNDPAKSLSHDPSRRRSRHPGAASGVLARAAST